MFIKELFRHWTYQVFAPGTLLRNKYNAFKDLLRYDDRAMELIADLEDIHYGSSGADWARIVRLCNRLSADVENLVECLTVMNPTGYLSLKDYHKKISFYISMGLDILPGEISPPYVLPLSECSDHLEAAGGKAANLARIAGRTSLGVPRGFTVTANAFNYFLEFNGLRPKLDRLLGRMSLSDPGEPGHTASRMRELVSQARVPDEIAAQILKHARDLAAEGDKLAVRSSAVAEDGEVSFAGQYDSVLNVDPKDAIAAYKQVLLGKYSPRAVVYRIMNGLADEETPMAVLVLPMIRAKSAGAAYSLDPVDKAYGRDVASVYAVAGLGDALVGGRVEPEVFRFTRERDLGMISREAKKGPGSGTSDETAADLVRAVLEIERLFGRPMEVEWAADAAGKIHILQAGPIRSEPGSASAGPPPETDEHDVLMSGLNRITHGAASGRVHHVLDEAEPEAAPQGAVLVVETLSASLASVAARVNAVVAASGSRAAHFASVAREFGLPVAVCDDDPFALLAPGDEVTLDADTGTVYAGRVKALVGEEDNKRRRLPGPAGKRLEKVMPLIARLNLTDPEAENFAPEGVRSMHDIIRFCHEKGVAEMFSLVSKGGRGMTRAKKLESELPMVMYILDLDKGLYDSAADKDTVAPDDFRCEAMRAVWRGLADKDAVWSKAMPHMDWQEFDRVSAGIFKKDTRLLASYAVVSQYYLHLMIRFGYHFSVLDALCGEDEKNNYVNFRFKGGGGSYDQRLLRLRYIETALLRLGFDTRGKGDMLDAGLARKSAPVILDKTAALGYLMAHTRLLDMELTDKSQVDVLLRDFTVKAESEGWM